MLDLTTIPDDVFMKEYARRMKAKRGPQKPHSRMKRTWLAMRSRCSNPNATGYKHYGGRGIKVCERWNSFDRFAADMGEPPSPQHSLDRINNEGDYEPLNCRWATRSEQALNKRGRKTRGAWPGRPKKEGYSVETVDSHKESDLATSGRWCCMCGHCRVARLKYSPR